MTAHKSLGILRQVWAQVLAEDESVIKDDDVFFDLGGDSLKAAELVDTAEEHGLFFTARDVFMNPSLQSLASCVSTASSDADEEEEYDHDDGAESEPLATSTQTSDETLSPPLPSSSSVEPLMIPKSLLSLSKTWRVSNLSTSQLEKFRTWRRVKLGVDVPLSRIKQACEGIVRAHPACRARFDPNNKCLVILDEVKVDISGLYRFCTRLYGNLVSAHIAGVEREALGSLDIVKGPVLSIDAYRTEAGICVFLVAHSLLMDDSSIDIILNDFDKALSEKIMPVPPEHNFWENVEDTRTVIHATIGNMESNVQCSGADDRWSSASEHHILDTSIRSTMEASSHTAGLELGGLEDTASKAALLHVLKKFNNVISPSIVHLSCESGRRPGWERVIGNFERTPLVLKTGASDWPSETFRNYVLQQIQHGLQPAIVSWSHDKLTLTAESNTVADICIHLRQYPERVEAQSYNFKAIAQIETALDWDLSREYHTTPHGHVELDMLISPSWRIKTTCRFHSNSGHAAALKEWATRLWENTTPETLQDFLPSRTYSRRSARTRTSRGSESRVAVERGTDNSNSSSFGPLRESGLPQATLSALSARYHLNVGDIESMYPCSPMQTSLMIDLDGSTNRYSKQLVFNLGSDVDLEGFKAAWEETVRANPVLRTRICHMEDLIETLQVVTREGVTWYTARGQSLTHFLQTDSKTPLGVGNAPGFRYAILSSSNHNEVTGQYFIWTVHHALCDGASIQMILSEVAARFHGKPVLPRQSFESFIRSRAVNPDPEQERAFWRRTLCKTSPTPYPRVRQGREFRADPSSKLRQTLAFDGRPPGGVTRALLLRAVWAILMAHYNGTEEVCFGVINSGRTAAVPGVSTMSGPTVNLVPITLHVDRQETVVSFFSRLHTQAAEMMPFEHSGMANIRKYVADSHTTALGFQTLMVVHPAEFSAAIAPAADGLGMKYMDNIGKDEQHPYPLVISCTLSSKTIDLSLQYDSRVTETQQAKNVICHFQAVLTQLTNASGDARVGSVELLNNNDMAQIAAWNRYTPPAENMCVDWLFRAQVAKQPSSTAVCSLEESLTYREVDEISSALALQLVRDEGVDVGDFVAVCFGKSIWTVVAIMAVFKAGGIYVPIDPAHPMGRIQEIVQSTGIKVALASQDGASVLNPLGPRILIIDSSRQPCLPEESLSRSVPHGLAYLLFTSGSTGKPKGILISHAAICTSIKHHGKAFGASPLWRTFQFCAHTFDISIGEFLTTLAHGGCICVPSDHDRLNNLAASITALNANTLLVVPTIARLLHPSDVPTLKTLVLGGEPVTSAIITRWAEHVKLICSYGPSETAVWSAANLTVTSDTHPAHIGHSIGGTMWIVHPENHHKLSAIGCVGELVVSGPILGDGYFNDAVTTDAAFVPAPRWLREINTTSSPISSDGRIYRTGDLARYNADGTFHIVGRRDTQVKLRGFRIELGEIENQCIASGTVGAALADLPDSGPCRGQIVAVVSLAGPELGVPAGEAGFILAKEKFPKMEQLATHLRHVLPEYMVPTVTVVLTKLPLLISGKVDRKAVKTWIRATDLDTYNMIVRGMTTGNTVTSSDISEGSLADRLRRLWSDVLHKPADSIVMDTSFFSLGGDSLAAIQVVSRAKAIGLPVTVRGIISANTLGNLAALVESSDSVAAVAEHTRVSAPTDQWIRDLVKPYESTLQMRIKDKYSGAIEDVYPLSPIQRDMTLAREVDPNVFTLRWKMRIFSRDSQPVSIDRLASSWKRVVRTHRILRTVFLPPLDTSPAVQVVLGDDVEPKVFIASASPNDPEPSFDSVGAQRDIGQKPLPHRALFYRYGDECHGIIELDHRLIDGWSLGLIRVALLEAYDGTRSNVLSLSEKGAPSAYRDFIAILHESRVKADERHWAAMLRGAHPTILASKNKLDTDYSHGTAPATAPEGDGKTVLHLPELKAQTLLAFCADNGTTVASIVDAAWAQTLSAYTHAQEVCFAYIDSGREENVTMVHNPSAIVGPLINILVHRVRTVVSTDDRGSSTTALAVLARRIQQQRGQAGAHVACSIREALEEKDDLSSASQRQRPLLCNTGVNFQRRPVSHGTGRLAVVDDLEGSRDPWHFDVLVRVTHTIDNDSLKAALEFNARQFDTEEMEEVMADFWHRIMEVSM